MLRRLFGKGEPAAKWPPPGPITSWPIGENINAELNVTMFDPTGAVVDVAGESAYQGTLETIGGTRTIDGLSNRDHTAVLLPEPDNPYDPNAVRVLVVSVQRPGYWGKVGYFSRSDAIAYRPVIDRLAESGRVVGCKAALKGGWDRGGRNRGSIGVSLHLASPRALMADLDETFGPDARWSVTPTGEERPYDRTDCPHCGVELHPLPKAKKRCPSCGEPIYVRAGPDEIRHLLRESDLLAFEATWEEHWSR